LKVKAFLVFLPGFNGSEISDIGMESKGMSGNLVPAK
jgi:hypothetical protein